MIGLARPRGYFVRPRPAACWEEVAEGCGGIHRLLDPGPLRARDGSHQRSALKGSRDLDPPDRNGKLGASD